jgi:hypothetical protein
VKVAENGGPGGCFQRPFHQSPTCPSGRFHLFLGFSAPSAQGAFNADRCSRFRYPLSLTLLPPPFLRGTYFSSTSSVPKMDLSPSTLRIMVRGILPTSLRPRLPIHRRPLSSGIYSLFSGTQASSHELTTIAALPCSSSFTLDRTRVL